MMKYYLFIILFVCMVAGCGNGQVPLKGKVVFSDDGSPVSLGKVVLSTATFQSRGDLNDKGEFLMESLRPGDGLPPGNYKVSIVGAIDYGMSGGYSLIDPKWSNPETSGMTIDVDKKTKFLEIKVDRNPQPKK